MTDLAELAKITDTITEFNDAAFDVEPDLPDGIGLHELLEKMEPDILGINRLVGT